MMTRWFMFMSTRHGLHNISEHGSIKDLMNEIRNTESELSTQVRGVTSEELGYLILDLDRGQNFTFEFYDGTWATVQRAE